MASSEDELRIVLIGRTGNGKSSTGNSLLHSRSAFHSAQLARSITRNCEVKTNNSVDINGQQKTLVVVDTPGFFDTDTTISNEMVQQTITSQIFNMTSPGVHAFLIVLRVDRFTPEEKDTVDFITTIFGAGAAQYCIILFTRADQLDEGQTIDDFISSSPALQELVDICGNRKFAINNKLNGEQLAKKTKQVLQMISQMVAKNNDECYTNEEYKRIEMEKKEEQTRREQEERDRKKAYEDALVAQARAEERQSAEKREREAREEERRIAEQRAQEAIEVERRRAEKREKEVREEKQRKAAIREQEERERKKTEEEARIQQRENEERQSAAASCRRNDNDDRGSLLSGMNGMTLGGSMFMPNTGMSAHHGQGTSRGHGGRFTGEYMATRGSANGKPVYEGSRGGQFYINSKGNKTYKK